MTQKNYPGHECYVCGICDQTITQPICPSCITIELEAWLTMYPDLKQKLLPKVHKFLKTLKILPATNISCIKCDKKASACPYCFTEFVFKELKRMEVNPIIIKEFIEFFNFDLEYKGYYKDAENSGIIDPL